MSKRKIMLILIILLTLIIFILFLTLKNKDKNNENNIKNKGSKNEITFIEKIDENSPDKVTIYDENGNIIKDDVNREDVKLYEDNLDYDPKLPESDSEYIVENVE